jgi:hypothetical protein
VQPQVANTPAIPPLDESTFQQVLQAAYVIQRQNDQEREARREIDPAATLAMIAKTQELLQSQLNDLNAAARLIVEQLRKITHATGIAIALVANDRLTYCAAAGSFTSLAGSSGPLGASVSEFLREEEALHRAPNDTRFELLGRHYKSPVFFPVYCQGTVAALLQLSFPGAEFIEEHEIRSCQLMAGLMGEAISRATELEWKQSLAAERATMLEALERLRPQLERLAAEPAEENLSSAAAEASLTQLAPRSAERPESVIAAETTPGEVARKPASSEPEFSDILNEGRLSSTCSNCGFQFSDDEKFCGRCGNRRTVELPYSGERPVDLGIQESTNGRDERRSSELEPLHQPLPDVVTNMPVPAAHEAVMRFASDAPATEGSAALAVAHRPAESEIAENAQPETQLEIVPEPEKPGQASPWSSARKARQWLHSLQPAESGWLVRHSGDVSVAIAALVLLLVLLGWNARPAQSKLAHGKTPPQPSLTLFERILVGLGVAEAPAAPVPLGNPNVQVWEDLHTGLYYCPGADLYGKTPGGKVTNQRDAQLDQFEPAARKACE